MVREKNNVETGEKLEEREEAGKKDLQLYKIHNRCKYKDTTEKWLTLSRTPHSKQNQNGQPLADNLKNLNMTFLNNSQTIYYMVHLY